MRPVSGVSFRAPMGLFPLNGSPGKELVSLKPADPRLNPGPHLVFLGPTRRFSRTPSSTCSPSVTTSPC